MTDCGRFRDCKHYRPEDNAGGICDKSTMKDGLLGRASYIYPVEVKPDFGCVQFEKREDSNGD